MVSQTPVTARKFHAAVFRQHEVRGYAKTMKVREAVEKAIEECTRNDVLADFLRNNRSERTLIESFLEEGFSPERIIEKLEKKYQFSAPNFQWKFRKIPVYI